MTRLRAWLELTRGANLPTVWSNVLVGWLLAAAAGATMDGGSLPALALAILGASLVYVAGMFLNDAADAAWDASRRPERPIPSGRVGRGAALLSGLALLLAGVLVLRAAAPSAAPGAVALALLVLAYTHWHKAHPASAPWLMGACRALLPIIGFLVNPPPVVAADTAALLLAHAVSLAVFTAGISLLARHESVGGEPAGFARAIPFLSAFPVPVALLVLGRDPWMALVWASGIVLLLGWSRRRFPDVGDRVAFRIASLALVDYLPWLAIRSRFEAADPLAMGGLAILLFFGTALALRRLLPST